MKYALLVAATALGLSVTAAPVAFAGDQDTSEAARIAHGGQLYDKWWKTLKVSEPTGTHTAYPADAAKSGSATWRCKECHGWDYIGAEGRYSSGSHFTGIPGIQSMAGGDTTEIAAAIRGEPHNLGPDMINDSALADLALFVSKGQFDVVSFLDEGKSTGDPVLGKAAYQTVCAGCHGLDGRKITEMPPMGELAGNAPEMMHKIMNGQPTETMPAMRIFGPQLAADIVAYVATLPK